MLGNVFANLPFGIESSEGDRREILRLERIGRTGTRDALLIKVLFKTLLRVLNKFYSTHLFIRNE